MKRAGVPIRLTAKEYALLEYLASNAGRVLSRTMIIEHVWDQSFEGLTNIVDVYVRQLRIKIDEPHERKLIHTVRSVGYCLSDEERAVNTRSIRFRLVAWYAGVFARRLRGLRRLHLREPPPLPRLGAPGQPAPTRPPDRHLPPAERREDGRGLRRRADPSLYGPELNDRFIRISRPDGSLLYVSGHSRAT